MKQQKYRLLGKLTAILFGGAMLAPGMVAAQEQAETAGAEVLTRGPVHEAFAGTVSFNPQVGIIVDQAPPALIEEVPPEQRLEGDNVAWIPGYWAWDEDSSDFLWISGIWRNLPPGRQWVPGYWAPIEGRHQWTSGYWEDAETTEVTYLPEPPKSVEAGPNIEASSNDQTWIPGNWRYRDDRYAWSAGYWAPARANWSWTPAYYRWSHRGYVYVDGYWDYPVVNRGVVFAPVHIGVGYRSRPDYYYTPSAVISLSVFANHLFVRPSYGHYYYGDYYEPRYHNHGFYASYSYSSSRYGYDPIYSHYRWENRNDRNWENGRRDYYEYRRDHQDARPPRTWAAMSARAPGDRNRDDFEVAQRYDSVVNNREGRQRFRAVDKQDRQQYVSQREDVRKFAKEREQLETRGDKATSKGDNERASVTKEKIRRSPVVAKKSDRSDKDGGPPARLQPRASEKDQTVSRTTDKAGANGATNGADASKAKRNKDGTVDRDSAADTKDKDKAETTTETRVKPGEKRVKMPNTQGKEKREATTNPQQKEKATSGEKRQADPTPERQANPTPKRQAEPTQGRKANPGERQANPTPERQANPTPKRQADPTPERKTKKSEEARESAAATVRKAQRQAEAQPKPAKQQAQSEQASRPQQQKKSQQATAQPKPAKQQAQREQAARPQQKSQQTAQSQGTAPTTQTKGQPTTRTAKTKAELTEEEKKKKKQVE